jgi:hypothetical protein
VRYGYGLKSLFHRTITILTTLRRTQTSRPKIEVSKFEGNNSRFISIDQTTMLLQHRQSMPAATEDGAGLHHALRSSWLTSGLQ